jgi:parallel beta-helix repeat protein
MKKLLLLVVFLLVTTSAEAATYYVKQSSSNSTNCANATSSAGNGPVNTIARGLQCLAGGDTLELMADGAGGSTTNNENLVSLGINPPSGTVLKPTTIKTFGTDTWRFLNPGGINFYDTGFQYVNIIGGCTTGLNRVCKLIWDGGGSGDTGRDGISFTSPKAASNVIFDGIRITGWAASRMGYSGNNAGGAIRNSRIDNNGWDVNADKFPGYGFYVAPTNFTIENNEIDNNGNYGIHMFTSGGSHLSGSGNVIRWNFIHNNGRTKPTSQASGDVLIGVSTGTKVYGNLIYGSGSEYGIRVDYDSRNAEIYNNTVYGSTYAAYGLGDSGGGQVDGTIFKNNIAHPSGGTAFSLGFSTNNTFEKNLCTSSGTGCDPTLTESASATFSDLANNIYTLKTSPASKAINNGTPLGSPYNVDIASTSRPQPPGGAWDIGAYESGVAPPVVTCPGVSPALVASYAFEDSSNDSTGTHTATLGTGWSYTGGKYGRGAISTGASGITVADHNQLDMCGGFTYMGWINLPNTSGDYAFIVKNPDAKSFLFAAITYTCGAGRPLAGYSQDPSNAAACYGTPLTTGSFQHMAVTYDASLPSANVKLYINGSLATSADGTTLLDATTGTLQFCTSGFNETCPSGTIIDEVKIYNYPRTAQQIVNDMDSAIQVGVPTELIISGGTRRIGPGTTLRYGLKK